MPASKDSALLARLSAELQTQPREDVTAGMVVQHALRLVPDAAHASVVVTQSSRRDQVLAANSDLSRSVDHEQVARKDGPGFHVAAPAPWVRSGDVAADARWPSWGPVAADAGVGSVLSLGLFANAQLLGTLNLYAERPDRFDDPADIELAVLYAAIAGPALSTAQLVSGLETAMSSRHQIGMAQGILMERYGLEASPAFALLKRLSSAGNRKLRLVAADVIAGREFPLLPGEDVSETPQ
jgi:GAF domain-containing protein